MAETGAWLGHIHAHGAGWGSQQARQKPERGGRAAAGGWEGRKHSCRAADRDEGVGALGGVISATVVPESCKLGLRSWLPRHEKARERALRARVGTLGLRQVTHALLPQPAAVRHMPCHPPRTRHTWSATAHPQQQQRSRAFRNKTINHKAAKTAYLISRMGHYRPRSGVADRGSPQELL